jgi:hypothetical protein
LAYIGKVPANAPLTSSDIADGIISTADLANTAVTGAKVNADVISSQTALAAEPADTDEFLVSDAGVIKRIDYSLIKGGGGLVHIKTISFTSGTSAVEFNDGSSGVVLDDTYDKYLFSLDFVPNDNTTPQMFFSVDAGSNFLSSNYNYTMVGRNAAEGSITRENSSDSQMELTPQTAGGGGDESTQMNIWLAKPALAGKHKVISYLGAFHNAANNLGTFQGTASQNSNDAAVNGVKFKLSSGNFASGTFSMFGISKG